MSTNPANVRLVALTRSLERKWKDTRLHWKDAKCGEFEQTFLAELTDSVRAAVAAIEKIDKLMARVRRDCE